MLWPMYSLPIRLCVGHCFRAHDQIFLFPFFCRTIALLFVLGRPLWREDGSVICRAICQWSESQMTHNHTVWYWVPFSSPLTTRRDYGGSILARLHTGMIFQVSAAMGIRVVFCLCISSAQKMKAEDRCSYVLGGIWNQQPLVKNSEEEMEFSAPSNPYSVHPSLRST
jgi:hypothetical protein